MEEKEIWKDVVGCEGLYQVSNNGRVRSVDRYVPAKNNSRKHIDGKLLTQHYDKDGYCLVHIRKPQTNGKNARVHRLVALTFIPSVEGKDFIDHINGIRSDNRVENLRWCTVKENNSFPLAIKKRSESVKQSYINNHKLRDLRSTTFKNCRKFCVQVLQYTKNGTFVADYASVTDAAKSVGGKVSNICRNCCGKRPSAYGYVWKYKE